VTAGAATVLRADARSIPLPDASVDLVVTSPPYFALRSYTDGGEHYADQIGAEPTPREYIASLIECTREWMRVLKPGGSLFVNLGDKYVTYEGPRQVPQNSEMGRTQGAVSQQDARHVKSAPKAYGLPYKSLMDLPARYSIRCIDDLGLIKRAEIIWSKTNGMPESCTDRVRRSHEVWFHFTREQRYFADMDPIREQPARWDPPRPLGTRNKTPRHTVAPDYTGWKDRMVSNNPNGKLPGSVWEVPTEPLQVPDHLDVDHFAAFPTEWPRRIIQAWSPAGGTVLDPFGGTGTTALVAKVLGRHGISVDRSADYCRLARWRTTDPGQLAKAMRVPQPPKALDGQQELFAGIEAVAS
jgi:DNA modification methylase